MKLFSVVRVIAALQGVRAPRMACLCVTSIAPGQVIPAGGGRGVGYRQREWRGRGRERRPRGGGRHSTMYPLPRW